MPQHYESDSLGPVLIDDDRLWGPQTQRSLNNFKIGRQLMPPALIHAIALVKQAAAWANGRLAVLPDEKVQAIIKAAGLIRSGCYDDQFPLAVYQTGSGTQTNMNVNEVISHLCAGSGTAVHPNDDVNKSQSTNDVFPTAMQIAAVTAVRNQLLPALDGMQSQLQRLSCQYTDQIKVGRTHLQDAVALTFGQETGGWQAVVQADRQAIESLLPQLSQLPLGATAVGTGLNAPAGFDQAAVAYISEQTHQEFSCLDNKFAGLSSKNGFVMLTGALGCLATDLIKIANDIRWLASGPRAGLGEINLPANEPGSSIMPGKVNPTQAEALIMVCLQVCGYAQTIAMANSHGSLQLNVTMPVIIADTLDAITILHDGISSFTDHLLTGLTANAAAMEADFENSLANAAVLNPVIGYDKTARLVKTASQQGISLKQAAIESGWLSETEFDRYYDRSRILNRQK